MDKITEIQKFIMDQRLSKDQALQTCREEHNKNDDVEVAINENDDSLQETTNELIAICKSNTYKDIFGGLCNGQPLEVEINTVGNNIGHLADYELDYIINNYYKKGLPHVVKFEELELKLRQRFCKIFNCNSVSCYIDQKIKDKQQLLNFGRGKNIIWPLAAIVALKEKQSELDPESLKNKKDSIKKESEDNRLNEEASRIIFWLEDDTDFSCKLILEDDTLANVIGGLNDDNLLRVINILKKRFDERKDSIYIKSISLLEKELEMRKHVLYLITTKISDKIKTFEDSQEYLNDEGTNLSLFREEFVHKYLKKVPFILKYIFYKAHVHKKNNDAMQIETPNPNDILGNKYTEEMKHKKIEKLQKLCRSDEYKEVFGDLVRSDPLTITLNETALNLAQKSDSSLQKMIDRCTDGEKDSLVKYEKLELRLRKQFYEIYQGESVKGILFRCIKDKHSLNRFGRGRAIVWPLEVVYRLRQKEKEFSQNKKEEVKEIPDNDMVNKPKHYMFNVDGHDVQAIDLVKGLLTPEEFRGWIKGSYFTYLMRADRKNKIEDLEKARTFLNWQIQLDKGEELTLPGKK